MISVIFGRWKSLKRNPIQIIVMIALPLIFSGFFSLAMSGFTPSIGIQVMDMDKSTYSIELINELKQNQVSPDRAASEKELFRKVSEGTSELGLIIPEGFMKDITQGKTPTLNIVKVKDTTGVFAFQGILRTSLQRMMFTDVIVREITASLEKLETTGNTLPVDFKQRVYDMVNEKWKETLPLSVEGHFLTTKTEEYNPLSHSTIGFILFFSMMNITFILGEILEEKQNGIWNRLMISPLSRLQIFSGNMVFAFMVGFIQVSLLVAISGILFRVDWGSNIFGVMLIMAIFVWCSASLGLFLTSIVKTHQQLQSIVPIITVSSSMLAGAFWPLEIVSSKVILTLANLMPQKWAIQGLEDMILRHQGIEAIYLPMAVLFLMSVVLLFSGVKLSERKA
ncbi:ABC transporter permease [Thermoanaerobacteraceae bacterium SP2]|jgi:ABC-2 type transport system permease protein|nr:ABC transporter permease [Thermoanaerobacteraceae bacterium SP2]